MIVSGMTDLQIVEEALRGEGITQRTYLLRGKKNYLIVTFAR